MGEGAFPSARQSLRKYTLPFTVAAAQVDLFEMSIPQSVMIIRLPGMLTVELLLLVYVHGVAPVMYTMWFPVRPPNVDSTNVRADEHAPAPEYVWIV